MESKSIEGHGIFAGHSVCSTEMGHNVTSKLLCKRLRQDDLTSRVFHTYSTEKLLMIIECSFFLKLGADGELKKKVTLIKGVRKFIQPWKLVGGKMVMGWGEDGMVQSIWDGAGGQLLPERDTRTPVRWGRVQVGLCIVGFSSDKPLWHHSPGNFVSRGSALIGEHQRVAQTKWRRRTIRRRPSAGSRVFTELGEKAEKSTQGPKQIIGCVSSPPPEGSRERAFSLLSTHSIILERLETLEATLQRWGGGGEAAYKISTVND